MAKWLAAITAADDDYGPVLDAMDHFDHEHILGSAELAVGGERISEVSSKIAGWFDYRWGQWKECEAIVEVLELRARRVQQKHRKLYLEHYNRDLSATTVERYAEAHADVIAVRELINRVKLVEGKMSGLCTAIEKLDRQVRILAELRRFGLDDATI